MNKSVYGSNVKGSQLAWDHAYQQSSPAAEGLHVFNRNALVQEISTGEVGRVLERTALTATIRFRNGRAVLADQFSREFICLETTPLV